MEIEKQLFVPHLLDQVYKKTWNLIEANFSYIFQNYHKSLIADKGKYINHEDYFTNTGDGGFQILETPIHAILFALTFATILRLYNAGLFLRDLHSQVGNIDVRYAATLDNVYLYDEKFYGAGIINNTRMLSKDRLDRFLIDKNTYDWFLDRTIGIENLMSLNLQHIKKVEEFVKYDTNKLAASNNNAIIPPYYYNNTTEGIKSIDVQKLGEIKSKLTLLEIYALHVQAVIFYQGLFSGELFVTVSVGNLNIEGIKDTEL